MYTKPNKKVIYPKTLGKIEASLLASLASRDKTIFTVNDALKVTGSSLHAVRLMLTALVNKKWLIRLNRGKYLIVPLSAGEKGEYSENWYVIAKNLIEPKSYYLSHYSALDIHEMITQPVLTIYISTSTRRIPKDILGANFRFVHLKPRDTWGTKNVWVTPSEQVRVSDLERTILDCLDRPDLCGGVSEVAKGLWAKRDSINYEKLSRYAKKLGRKSVAKRLGFLLETLSLADPELLTALKQLVTKSYTSLDPMLPASGRYVSFWKVQVNINPEEIKRATET